MRLQLALKVDDLDAAEEMQKRIIGRPTITDADTACSAPAVGANRT